MKAGRWLSGGLLTGLVLLVLLLARQGGGPGAAPPQQEGLDVVVETWPDSAFVRITVRYPGKLGKSLIEVRGDHDGSWFTEWGKTNAPEMVHRIGKENFTKGSHTVRVTARGATVTRHFTIE